MTDEELTLAIDGGNEDVIAECPASGCIRTQWVSPDDPDSSFSDLLSHISIQHPEIDRTPAVLWPTIKFREED